MKNVELSKDCEASSLFLYLFFFLEAEHSSTILATPVASVSRALYSGQDDLAGHAFAVLGEAQEAHEVDETSGKVQLAAKLAGCIVIGEGVVVVVESLTCWTQEKDVRESRWKHETGQKADSNIYQMFVLREYITTWARIFNFHFYITVSKCYSELGIMLARADTEKLMVQFFFSTNHIRQNIVQLVRQYD